MTADRPVVYDCQACGACCRSPWTGKGYALIDVSELPRLKRIRAQIVDMTQGSGDETETLSLLGTRIDAHDRRVCYALEGTIGEHVTCGIYADRPEVCRRFAAGSQECREARRKHSIAD